MSFICGILSRRDRSLASVEALDEMLAAVRHRGPHGTRRFTEPLDGVALAYTHNGAFGLPEDSPSWHEDERFVAAVDGDLFHPDPATQKAAAHLNPAQAAATSYEADRTAFPGKLDGFFSLFLWDRRGKTLHLVSDRLARRMLYYFHDSSRDLTVFATELKAVLAHRAVPRALDETLLPMHFSAGLVPAPFTLAKDVRKLLPAERLTFGPQAKSSARYWRPSKETGPEEFEFWTERMLSELQLATERTAGEAKAISVQFSGGLDSTLVLGAVSRLASIDVLALTLVFKNAPPTADPEWAERVARLCAVPHDVIVIDPETDLTPDLVSAVLGQMDEPHASAGRMFSEYFLCRASLQAGINSTLSGAAPGDPVSLIRKRIDADPAYESGDIGEGLLDDFPGARYFREERIEQMLGRSLDPVSWRQAALANLELLPRTDLVSALLTERRLRSAASRITLFSQFAAPFAGVEERSPFLETGLAEFMLSVPPALFGLYTPAMKRGLYKLGVKRLLGIDLDDRTDDPLPGPPLPEWLAARLVADLEPLVDERILRQDYFAWLQKGVRQSRKRASDEAWQLFLFNFWYQTHIKGKDPLAGT